MPLRIKILARSERHTSGKLCTAQRGLGREEMGFTDLLSLLDAIRVALEARPGLSEQLDGGESEA